MREGIRERELRPIGDAVEGDASESKCRPNRFDVLGMIARRVELPAGPDQSGTIARERLLLLNGEADRPLKDRTVDQTRLARAAIIECEEGVPGEGLAQFIGGAA